MKLIIIDIRNTGIVDQISFLADWRDSSGIDLWDDKTLIDFYVPLELGVLFDLKFAIEGEITIEFLLTFAMFVRLFCF